MNYVNIEECVMINKRNKMMCNRAHGLGADGNTTKPEWIIRDSEDKSV